eukprot:6923914-Alexandrium_andersonii.AAC.1
MICDLCCGIVPLMDIVPHSLVSSATVVRFPSSVPQIHKAGLGIVVCASASQYWGMGSPDSAAVLRRPPTFADARCQK